MKRLLFLAIVLVLTNTLICNSQSIHAYSSGVQTLVNSVSGDSLWSDIGKLQGMERYATNTKAIASSNYLKNYFKRLGYDSVYFHTFNSSYIPNVIAVKYGKTIPDSIVIVGAHYDVYASGAPGADDNGSGTAATMEAGRVLAGHDYKRTIKLICFSGEEEWIKGSSAYASAAKKAGDKIIGAMAMDAIAYLYPGDPINCDVYSNAASKSFRNIFGAYTALYMPGFGVADVAWPTGIATSDCEAFWKNGYQAIMPAEGQFIGGDHMSPYMHSSDDILNLSANSKEQAAKITQSVVATAAGIAELYITTYVEENNINRFHANIFPNPAAYDINVSFVISNNDEVYITLTDMSGRIVRNIKKSFAHNGLQSLNFSVSDIKSGLYFINIRTGNKICSDKISIVR